MVTAAEIVGHHLTLRIALVVAAVACALLGPWWLTLVLALVPLVWLGAYEAVFAGLVLDVLFAPGFAGGVYGEYLFTGALALVAAFVFVVRLAQRRTSS